MPPIKVKKKAGALPPPSTRLPYMTPATPAIPDPPQPPRSMLWPAGDYDGDFIDPQIPEGLFMMRFDDDENHIDGPYDGSRFLVEPETNIAYSDNGGGSPVAIRATDRVGDHLIIINGDGSTGTIDILPYPYEPDESRLSDTNEEWTEPV